MFSANTIVAQTALVGMRMRAGNARRRRARQRHREAHGRQHARQADVLCRQPHGEGAHELQDDGRRDVLHPLENALSQPSQCRARDQASQYRQKERRRHRLN
jgi:hypothetical protein